MAVRRLPLRLTIFNQSKRLALQVPRGGNGESESLDMAMDNADFCCPWHGVEYPLTTCSNAVIEGVILCGTIVRFVGETLAPRLEGDSTRCLLVGVSSNGVSSRSSSLLWEKATMTRFSEGLCWRNILCFGFHGGLRWRLLWRGRRVSTVFRRRPRRIHFL